METIEIPLNLDGTANTTDESGYTNGTTQYPAGRMNSEHAQIDPTPEAGSPTMQDFNLVTIDGWQGDPGDVITLSANAIGWGSAAIVEDSFFVRNFDPQYFSPNTVLWLDATDVDSVTIETGVSQWDDKSSRALTATQGTAADQLDYVLGEYVESHGPGENEHLDIASDLETAASQPFTILARMKTLSGDWHKFSNADIRRQRFGSRRPHGRDKQFHGRCSKLPAYKREQFIAMGKRFDNIDVGRG